jgi:dihydrofolate reductase
VRRHDWSAFNSAPTPHNSRKLQISFSKLEEVDADESRWAQDWWGENPPFHTPVFVLTHHARDPLEMQRGTTFHFVTEGINAALDQARDAARGKDITLGGGAEVAQQYLKAGLIDEMQIHVVPVLLGNGTRLFDHTGGRQTGYECVRVVNSPSVSHYKYRRKPQGHVTD